MQITKEYICWSALKARCYNKNHVGYVYYGARGVKVCDRWLGKDGYKNFLSDVGVAPTKEHSLDRFPDKDGDYEPGNVRWATPAEQANNKRNNVFYMGKTIAQLEKEKGYRSSLISSRKGHGWSMEDAVNTPPRKKSVISENTKQQIIAMFLEGVKLKEIAEKTGVKYQSANTVLRNNYLKLKKQTKL